jgi:hypothetical protein
MQKWMIIAVRNPTGFHSMRVLPSGCKFNSSYHQNERLRSLSEWRSEQAGAASRRFMVHVDNARPHARTAATSQKYMEENGMMKAPHPHYSPGLSPFEFCLFDYVKHCLRGRSFEAAGELFSARELISMGMETGLWMPFSRVDAKTSGMHCNQW